LTIGSVSLGRRILDVLGARSAARGRAIRAQAIEYLGRLLEVNGARIKNDLRDRVSASRGKLELEVRSRLRDRVEVAAERLERARALREDGVAAVAAERGRLAELLSTTRALESRVANPNPAVVTEGATSHVREA
jgi:hypothetical protein